MQRQRAGANARRFADSAAGNAAELTVCEKFWRLGVATRAARANIVNCVWGRGSRLRGRWRQRLKVKWERRSQLLQERRGLLLRRRRSWLLRGRRGRLRRERRSQLI